MIKQTEKIEKLELLKEGVIFLDIDSPTLSDGYIISLLKNSVNEFQTVVLQNGNHDMFRGVISSTIEKIEESEIGLDTEDKEIVCLYFEKMMDAVELASSGGILNTWIYGFDPREYEVIG